MMEPFIFPVRMISGLDTCVTNMRMRSCMSILWPHPLTASPCVRTMITACSSPTQRVTRVSAGYTISVTISRIRNVGRKTVWLDPSILTLMTAVPQNCINFSKSLQDKTLEWNLILNSCILNFGIRENEKTSFFLRLVHFICISFLTILNLKKLDMFLWREGSKCVC